MDEDLVVAFTADENKTVKKSYKKKNQEPAGNITRRPAKQPPLNEVSFKLNCLSNCCVK